MKLFVNALTGFRILAAIALIPLLMMNMYATTFFVYTIAALTDFFDGWLAKKYNVVTKLGAVADQIGDKLLVVSGLFLVALMLPQWFMIIPAILIILRNVYVSGLREALGAMKQEMPVAKNRFDMAKIATALEQTALGIVFFWAFMVSMGVSSLFIMLYVPMIATIVLWLGLAAALWSATTYTIKFLKKIK